MMFTDVDLCIESMSFCGSIDQKVYGALVLTKFGVFQI